MNKIYYSGEKKRKLRFFLSDLHRDTVAFSRDEQDAIYLNKHNYAEIHMISDGTMRCTVDGKDYCLSAGDAVLVPAGSYHACLPSDRRRHEAFQADIECDAVAIRHFPPELFEELFARWREGNETVINYLTFICNELTGRADFRFEENRDDRYLISSYIEQNYYRGGTVKELAALLHLSEMHTQRLVKKYTGKSFGRCMREHRINIAEQLMKTGTMTREAIARYVGYASYNGFWKAYQKEKSEHDMD